MPRAVRAHHGCWGIITFSLMNLNAVSWEPEGPYHYSNMLHWEPEGHYNNHRLCTAIAPFYIIVLNGTYLNINSALLALNWWCTCMLGSGHNTYFSSHRSHDCKALSVFWASFYSFEKFRGHFTSAVVDKRFVNKIGDKTAILKKYDMSTKILFWRHE